MKAIVHTAYGSPDVLTLRDVDKPVPNADEVLVRVHAASVTTADGMIREGTPWYGRPFIGLTRPRHAIPGAGFAGVVEALGERVTRFSVGERVFGEAVPGFGAHAEYVRVAADGTLATMPDGLGFDAVAPLCDGALTALCFLRDVGDVCAGQRLLVNGASGSIGTAAVQLAKHLGAEVTGVCGPDNVELVRSLGADAVIDYSREDFTAGGGTWDVVFDTVGKSSFGRCRPVLADHGLYLSPVLSMPLLLRVLATARSRGRKAKFAAVGLRPPAELRVRLEEIRSLIEAGALRSVIDRHYPLADAVEAHRYVATGHKRGNVVLDVAA